MAEKLNGAGKKPAKDKKSKDKAPAANRKAVTAGAASLGHNLKKLRDEGVPFLKRLFDLQEQMDFDTAGYRVDFKNLYAEAGKALGIKSALIKSEFARMKAKKKEEELEREMAEADRDQVEAFRASLEGTPFGAWAAGNSPKARLRRRKNPGATKSRRIANGRRSSNDDCRRPEARARSLFGLRVPVSGAAGQSQKDAKILFARVLLQE